MFRFRRISLLCLAGLVLSFASLCAETATTAAAGTSAGPALEPGAGWTLVWADEFNGQGLPDPANWSYESGYIRNSEQQLYTEARPDNARLADGKLIIEARKEKADYTSASLTTKGKHAWKYGRVVVRAKLPVGRGIWPAGWMLGANHDTVGWPRCGEIDIMELVGWDPTMIRGNVHNFLRHDPTKPKGQVPNMKGTFQLARPDSDFHEYMAEWDGEKVVLSVDGSEYFTYHNPHTGVEAWPYDQPFYIILNVAVGGSLGGIKGIDGACFPQRMEIDYVRVYQRH